MWLRLQRPQPHCPPPPGLQPTAPPPWCPAPHLWAPRQFVHASVAVAPGLAHWVPELSTSCQPKHGPESQQAWRQPSSGDRQAGGHRKSVTGPSTDRGQGEGNDPRGDRVLACGRKGRGGLSGGDSTRPRPDSPRSGPKSLDLGVDGRRGSDSYLSSRPPSLSILKRESSRSGRSDVFRSQRVTDGEGPGGDSGARLNVLSIWAPQPPAPGQGAAVALAPPAEARVSPRDTLLSAWAEGGH